MYLSYFIILSLVFSGCVIIDVTYAKVFSRYSKKLFFALLFLYSIFLLRIYMGVKMGLWLYGDGIVGFYLFSVPIEEYIFMGVAPYATIVLWESTHKLLRKQRKKK